MIEIKVVKNIILNNILNNMINLPGCIVLSPGVARIFKIRKIQRLQLFPMTLYIVLVEIKVVRN